MDRTKYFCAKCQKKYDIGDIATNLYDICKSDIEEKLKVVFNSAEGERKLLHVFLTRFINTREVSEKFFCIKGAEVEKHLQNYEVFNNCIKGEFVITVGWIIDRFVSSGVYNTIVSSGKACENPASIPSEIKSQVLYQNQLIFYFSHISNQGEVVFDHVADRDNVPFPGSDGSLMGYKRVCPHCGRELSRAVGRAPEVIIWLAGTSRAAKTSSLISIASGLSSGKYSQYGISMQPIPYENQEWIHEQIEIYDAGYKVTKTPISDNFAQSQSILVRIGDSNEKYEKRVITFVDIPGEFFSEQDNEKDNKNSKNNTGPSKEFFKQYSGIISCMDFIWLHISKLAIHEIDLGNVNERNDYQNRIAKESAEDVATLSACTAKNIELILSVIKEIAGDNMPPVAVIMTKAEIDLGDFDDVKKYSLFPTEVKKLSDNVNTANIDEIRKILVADKRDRYRLNEMEFFTRANDVRRFVMERNPNMVEAIEANCPHKCYFSTAAYGHAAAKMENDDVPQKPTPYHEMLPLIWTMVITGAIQVIHLCSWSKMSIFGNYKEPESGSAPFRFSIDKYLKQKNNSSNKDKRRISIEEADLEQLNRDIAANLLMEGVGGKKYSYTKTAFLHGRE